MDFTISEQKTNMVSFGVINCFNLRFALFQDVREFGGTHHFDLRQYLFISFDHVLNTIDVWLFLRTIQWEAMTNLVHTHELWDTAEAVEWIHLIRVVLVQNRGHCFQTSHVLVLPFAQVMQTLR
jgi:hypothetical protein